MCLALVLSLATAAGQSPKAQDPGHASVVDFVRSVTSFLSAKGLNPKTLHETANRIATTYSAQLKDVRKRSETFFKEATTRFDEMDWQTKWNLAVELWRIHASLDLLQLLSADTLSQITGLNVPDLHQLQDRFHAAETRVRKALPAIHF